MNYDIIQSYGYNNKTAVTKITNPFTCKFNKTDATVSLSILTVRVKLSAIFAIDRS